MTVGIGEALGGFLRALGMDTARLPASVAECSALYRSVLAGRRVLVVLDDAGSEQQVRSLLPNQPGCAVIVTSRAPLSGLEGATQLTDQHAVRLLARLVGSDRVDAEPGAAGEIVRLCGRLPLALRIAGARLAARPRWPLRVLATRLGDERRRLDELAAGDREVRASIEFSYRRLGERERRAFRLLGVLGLADFAWWLLAPLLDESVSEVGEMMDRLADAQLLDFSGVDGAGQLRYRFHDLVRLFARECGEAEDPLGERAVAVGRVLRYWLALIDTTSGRQPSTTIPVLSNRHNASIVDAQLANDLLKCPRAWFESEQDALITAVERASELGLDDLSCDVAAALASLWFRIHNRFDEWQRTHNSALAAARQAGNLRGQAVMLNGLGRLHYELDRFAEANEYFDQALDLSRQANDSMSYASALAGLGSTRREQGQFAEALRFLEQALHEFRELGDCNGTADVAYETGIVHRELGQFGEAMAALNEALVGYRAIGSRRSEGLILRSIGLVHRATGDLMKAEKLCLEALEVFQETGDRLSEAYTVQALAKVHIRQGRGGEDLDSLTTCLTVFRELRDRFGQALALRTLGELHLAEGALDTAAQHLIEALSRWDELHLPLFRARTQRDLAELYRRCGDLTAANAMLKEALEVFRRYRSREYAEIVRSSEVHETGA